MKRTMKIATLVVAIGTSAVLAVQITHAQRSSPRDGGQRVAMALPYHASLPFPDAVSEPTIAAAEAALGWHIVRPHSCPADDSLITAIYVSVANNLADITYQDVTTPNQCYPVITTGHVEVTEERAEQVLSDNPPTTPTLTQSTQDQATGLGPVASVQTVAGVPAVVIQGTYAGDCAASPQPGEDGCAPPQSNPPSVSFQSGQVDIQIIGDPTWSTTMMVEISNTVT